MMNARLDVIKRRLNEIVAEPPVELQDQIDAWNAWYEDLYDLDVDIRFEYYSTVIDGSPSSNCESVLRGIKDALKVAFPAMDRLINQVNSSDRSRFNGLSLLLESFGIASEVALGRESVEEDD